MSNAPPPPAARALRSSGLRPRKRLGQNFLRDKRYIGRILEAADVGSDDSLLEIGAGTGVLTAALIERASRVVAVELDDNLYSLLSSQFGDRANLQLVHANGLDIDPAEFFNSDPYKLVANIPYYITGPLLRHFLEAPHSPQILVLMIQREVAERLVAKPGNLTLLGVSVQYYAAPKIIARVPAAAFYPTPKVESAIVRLAPHRPPPPLSEREAFFTIARAGFSVRRKQLVNALQNGLHIARSEALDLLRHSDIDPHRRAETLTIDEWRNLAQNYAREAHSS